MDVGAAWIALTNADDVGLKSGRRLFFMSTDRQVHCYLDDTKDNVIILNHTQFLDEFSRSRFVYINKQSKDESE